MTVSEVENSLKVSGRHISVDAPLADGEDSSLLDVLRDDEAAKPDNALIDESLSKEVEYALMVLTTREADVLRYFFGLGGRQPLTLEEIGTNLGLTRERVRQIKEKSIRRLRATTKSRILKAYLGGN
jgi:RNA polymerase primary sigma factor